MNNFDEPSIFNRNSNMNSTLLGSYASKEAASVGLQKQMQNIGDLTSELNEILQRYKDITDAGNKLTETQKTHVEKMQELKKATEEYNKNNIKDVNETYDLVTRLNKMRLDDLIQQRREMRALGQDTEAISGQIDAARKEVEYFKDEIKGIEDNLKNYNNRWSNLKTQLGEVKRDLGQMAQLAGLDAIKDEISGKAGSWREIANQNMGSVGGSTSTEWNEFKNDLIGNVQLMNAQVGQAVYGLDDVKNYAASLTKLGIYDNTMAEAQLKAVIEGNKILGMNTETQANILKLARRSNNEALLEEMNDTFATLMNMDIGLNKEMLNQIVSTNTGNADLLSFLGNGDAIKQLEKGAAYLTSNYGENVATAASNVLQDLLQNGTNSQAYVQLGGADDILQMAMNGNADQALIRIVEKAQQSGYMGAVSGTAYGVGNIGADQNLMSIYNTPSKRKSYSQFSASYNQNQTNASDMSQGLVVSLGETIKNTLGLATSKIFGVDATLENMFYTASLAYYAVATTSDIWNMLSNKKLGDIILGNGKMKALGTNISSSFTSSAFGQNLIGANGLTAQVGAIAGSIALIAGAVWTIKDGVDGYNKYKSGEWEKDKHDGVSSAIGGALGGTDKNNGSRMFKNAAKFALIGAGLGTIFPGLGTVLGAILGGLIGLTLGAIGGENISKGLHSIGSFFGSLFGGSSKEKTGEDAKGGYSGNTSGLPIGGGGPSAPTVNSTAKGGATQLRKYPWTRTSYFDEPRHYMWNGKWVDDRHNGVDLATSAGTPIGSNTSGTVTGAGTYKDGMNYFTVKDANGYTHIYYHMQQPPGFKVGETVNAGQMFGKVGSTGQSTGPHLHYGLKNPSGTLIDPEPYITDNIFNPSADGNGSGTTTGAGETIALEDMFASKSIVPNLSRKLTSTDTRQTEAVLARYSGIGSGPDIISNITKSVDDGFSSLNAKLDELADRQDKSEEMLRSITSPSSNAMYNY